jgi:hypothetical protein
MYAKVIADSIGEDAPRLVTFELNYQRFVHGEFMTHRVLSRNASSSRAIPVDRMLRTVEESPALPSEWRMNEGGMQGFTVATPEVASQAEQIVREAMVDAVRHTRRLQALGLHKQHVNRYTEPFQFIKVVATTSNLANFMGLRDHEAADPTMYALAVAMKEALAASEPVRLLQGQWHLPYIDRQADEELAIHFLDSVTEDVEDITNAKIENVLRQMSAARCARVSYNNFDGKKPTVEADLALFDKLVGSQPIHASPAEHQASPDLKLGFKSGRWNTPERHGNLTGWLQFRKFIPFENLELVA